MNRARRDELTAMLRRCHIDDRGASDAGGRGSDQAKVDYELDGTQLVQQRVEVFGRVRSYCNDIRRRFDGLSDETTVADVVKRHPNVAIKVSGLALSLGKGSEIAISPVTLAPASPPEQASA